MGVAFDDGEFSAGVTFGGSFTDPARSILLTTNVLNRQRGTPGSGVVLANAGAGPAITISDDHVTVERFEIAGGSGAGAHGIEIASVNPANLVTVRANLIHETGGDGVRISDADSVVDIYDNCTDDPATAPNCTSRTAELASDTSNVLLNFTSDPSPSTNNYCLYLGSTEKFRGASHWLVTGSTGDPEVEWDYWNGSSWASVDTGAFEDYDFPWSGFVYWGGRSAGLDPDNGQLGHLPVLRAGLPVGVPKRNGHGPGGQHAGHLHESPAESSSSRAASTRGSATPSSPRKQATPRPASRPSSSTSTSSSATRR